MSKETIRLKFDPAEIPEDDSYPVFVPSVAVMISFASPEGRASITPIVAWSIVSRFPFMAVIALCHGHYTDNYFPRYSNRTIREAGEFVLNIPHDGLRDAISKTGDVSGNDPTVDKFAYAGLTPGPAQTVKCPIIVECPINLECKVTSIVRTGSHDLFIAEVTAIQHDPILSRDIQDDMMVVKMLLKDAETGATQERQMLWRTLPTFS
ncbi:MAG: flavin reductase family protein [Anaerolineae bacterium]|nr:flavin reductase family protein [Anaerolineae bacterium]